MLEAASQGANDDVALLIQGQVGQLSRGVGKADKVRDCIHTVVAWCESLGMAPGCKWTILRQFSCAVATSIYRFSAAVLLVDFVYTARYTRGGWSKTPITNKQHPTNFV